MNARRWLVICSLVPPAFGTAEEAPAGSPAALPVDPVNACRCHDGLAPEGKAQPIDLRGWARDGVHRQQGCGSCHLLGEEATPHAMPLQTVSCASCHAEQAALAREDVHGRAQGKDPQLKGCDTCHGEHDWYPATDSRTRYLPTGLTHACASCHTPRLVDPLLTLPVKPRPDGTPWPTGPHGFLVSGEFRYVTQCESCHGEHAIFNTSDPRSKVSPERIPETCGGCHEGATAEALNGRICYTPGEASWAFRSYFDVWYLWTAGMLAMTLAGLAVAFVTEAVVRRRRRRDSPEDGTRAA